MISIFSSIRLILAASFCCVVVLEGEELPFRNPIAEPIQFGDLTLEIEEWIQFPRSKQGNPKTRINAMKPATDGTARTWVCDLEGLLYFIRDDEIYTYLDVRDYLPDFYAEEGLGGGLNFFAFHPEFKSNGLFYTVYSERPGDKEPDFVGKDYKERRPLDSILVEWKTEAPEDDAFKGTHRELMRVRFPIHIHTMQDISFNPLSQPDDEDYGLLYIGIGEGGSMKTRQYKSILTLGSLLGTIARIDPSGSNSANGQYGIPADNPWAEDGDPETLGEIWSIGFRNPHRLTWDPAFGDSFLATDIGEDNVEELNLIKPRRNYGWPMREGTFQFQLDPNKFSLLVLPVDDVGFTYPVAQYDHTEGDAIIGGYVYRGERHPSLEGKYVFGDVTRGHVYYVNASDLQLGKQAEIRKLRLMKIGEETTMRDLTGNGRVDLRFGLDHNRELYLMEKFNGRVYRIKDVLKD